MTRFDSEYICRFLKERSGLVITPEKQYLVENRLMPVARRHECANVAELIQRLKTQGSESMRLQVVEAMMNNESFFFRDKIPFDRLSDTALPELAETRARTRRIRVWSAAASTGQEAYSVAMTIDEMPQFAGWSADIVATDISGDALARAKSGLYSQFEVQRGLPIQKLLQHFEQIGDQWRISEKMRSMVHFRQVNLLHDFSFLGTFDLVLCRNVLIYFDHATKMDVLARIRRVTAPDGYLVLGAAETMVGLGDSFVPVPDKRGLYRPTRREPPRPGLKAVPAGAKVA